jgi:two-component system sensor histidine kinase BaeS
MRRLHLPFSLRWRLFLGIALTVAVSLAVTLSAAALLTQGPLDKEAIGALTRQIDLIAAQRQQQHTANIQPTSDLGDFLATEQEHLAILKPRQAELLLPAQEAILLHKQGRATGTVVLHGTSYDFAARRSGPDALVLLRTARRQAADRSPFYFGLLLATLVGALLAAAVAFALARMIARPITRVAGSARRLAQGFEIEPLPVSGSDEVAGLAESFNYLAQELEKSQAAERAFLLSISHELKTPLTAIRGHGEALSDGLMDPVLAGKVIERESHRLERLIQDLLDLARLRRRSFSVESVEVDLGKLAQDVVARHAGRASEFEVGLAAEFEPQARALADPDRLLQAASNLVENALRVTPAGGHVTVVAKPGLLEVRDDGPGIGAEEQEHAFDRFYLYERYGKERAVGTGLGLAIVRELAVAMGGTVSVESELGRGTAFRIELKNP